MILGRSLMALAGVVAALAVAELVIRFVVADTEGLMVKDALLGQKYRPLLHRELYDEEAGRRIDVRINSSGFRDREHAQVAPAGVQRVVMLGDSFAAGMSVDFEQTFPQVSERLLNETAPQPSWEVVNLAVAGYGTTQEMLAYEQYGRALRPRIVVLNFFAGNDVSDNSPELSTNPRPYFTRVDGQLVGRWPSASRRQLSGWLDEHSSLYIWQKTQMQKVERFVKRTVVVNPVHRVFIADTDEAMARAWAVTEALILKLETLTRLDGAQLLVSYIPFADEVNPDWWEETKTESPMLRTVKWDFDRPSKRLAELCARHGIAFGSPRELFEPRSGDDRLFFKHGHFNAAGHEVYARYLAATIHRLTALVGSVRGMPGDWYPYRDRLGEGNMRRQKTTQKSQYLVDQLTLAHPAPP